MKTLVSDKGSSEAVLKIVEHIQSKLGMVTDQDNSSIFYKSKTACTNGEFSEEKGCFLVIPNDREPFDFQEYVSDYLSPDFQVSVLFDEEKDVMVFDAEANGHSVFIGGHIKITF